MILGDRCSNDNLLVINEKTKEKYNRKNMVKKPNSFWKYYKDKIYDQDFSLTDKEQAINKLINTGVFKTVINLNYTGNIKVTPLLKTNLIELRGNVNTARCMSCDKTYDITKDMLETDKVVKCECGGKIAPTITMFGEKYRDKYIQEIKDSIFKEDKDKVTLNTHNLIFVGIDFEEDYLHEIIESYNAIKHETEQEETYTTLICEKDGVSVEYYQPEFATEDNITDSINRLIKLF